MYSCGDLSQEHIFFIVIAVVLVEQLFLPQCARLVHPSDDLKSKACPLSDFVCSLYYKFIYTVDVCIVKHE